MTSAERMINHLIMQFGNSPVLHIILNAFGAELDELRKAYDDLLNLRWIDTGRGVQLDNIGVLIDRSRRIDGAIQLEFFAFYDQPNALSFGVGRFRDTPAVAYLASSTLDDETYRPVLWHKIAKDTATGTAENTIESVKFIYGAPYVTLTELGNAKIGLGIGKIMGWRGMAIYQVMDRIGLGLNGPIR